MSRNSLSGDSTAEVTCILFPFLFIGHPFHGKVSVRGKMMLKAAFIRKVTEEYKQGVGPPDSLSLPSSVVLGHVMTGLRNGGMTETCMLSFCLGRTSLSHPTGCPLG